MLIIGNKRNRLPADTQTSDAGGTVTMQHSATQIGFICEFYFSTKCTYFFLLETFHCPMQLILIFTSRKAFCFGGKKKIGTTKSKLETTIYR